RDTVVVSSCRTDEEHYIEDASALDKSDDSDLNNNRLEPDTNEVNTNKENCMNIRIRIERMFDYLSAYVGKLTIRGSSEAEVELAQVERGMQLVIEKLNYDQGLRNDPLPLRRDLAVEGRPPSSVKQMRRGGFRCQIEMMLKRTELRVDKKKCGIPPLIAEDIEGDDEQDLCSVCDRREPPDSSDAPDAPIDWVQCDECQTWAHLECIQSRECVCCGGVFEVAPSEDSDVQSQENQEN
ncbi:hypothetical protein OSTOST_16930, partial [Ostertagia ostertagi]